MKSDPQMLSWKLWQALKNPPYRHPLMRRVRSNTGWLTLLGNKALPFYLYAMLLGTIYMLWRITPQTFGFVFLLILIIPSMATLFFLVSPLLFPLVMVAVGAMWAALISERMVEQQEHGIYDLLCVLPGGRWAANWAIACGSIHQGSVFEICLLILRIMLLLGGILLFMLLSMVLGQVFSAESQLDGIGSFSIDMIALLVAYYLHYIQTMALSPLVGLLVPTYTKSRVEARLGAVGLLAVVQLGPFIFCGLLFYFVPLLVGGTVDPERSLALYLILVFGLREVIIRRLWYVLLRRLRLTAVEKEHLWSLLRLAP
ncbi:hypothetical protein ACFLYO_02340 [Chloroflexota bacterium]